MPLEVLLLIFCLASAAFFAGMETGVISINRLRLRHLVRRNVKGARILENFLAKPDRLFGTTLVGTNLGYVIAAILTAGLGNHWMGPAGSWIMGVGLTLTILVFCEYIPKAWFQSFPAKRTIPFAKTLEVAARLLSPISRLVTGLVRLAIPGPAHDERKSQPFISREELRHLTREGEKSGVLTPEEHRMIHGVFELKAKTCGEIMVARNKIGCVQQDTPVTDLLERARQTEHNRFPVVDPATKAFVGIVHIFDVLADEHSQDKTARDYMRPPQLVSMHTPVDHVLPRMRVTRQPMVLVADDRMEVVGLVTLEDVLEEIVGVL